MHPLITLSLATVCLATTAFGGAAEPPTGLPASTRRVLCLGDSITHGGFYLACVETYFVLREPERRIEFINAGLSSETVSGLSEDGHAGGEFPRPNLHERLARVLTRVKPDVVFACYGMNDGIYLPFDETRFAAYQSGLQRLRAAVAAIGATVVHLTPPVFTDVKGNTPAYAGVLDRYSEWLVDRRTDGWAVIDLHFPMKRAVEARRQREPGFSFARDGVHPGEEGHWLMAREIIRQLGARDLAPDARLEDLLGLHSQGAAIFKLVRTRSELQRDAWLTATGHTRPKAKAGLPLEDAEREAAAVKQKIESLRVAGPGGD